MYATEIYGSRGTVVQPVSQPASPANSSTTPAPAVGGTHESMAWLGLVIALVLWRIVYEMSEGG